MDSALRRFVEQQALQHFTNRAIRLQLAETATLPADALLPQRVVGTEGICDGFEYRAMCISIHPGLPLKDFIGQRTALEFTTDAGAARRVCGIITEATAGASDGSISTYQIVIRDAFAFLEKRINCRVFRGMTGREIIKTILDEWRQNNLALAQSFHYEFIGAGDTSSDPAREFTMQYNESDAAFIQRLLGCGGWGWHFRPGASTALKAAASDQQPMHTLVMYRNAQSLPASPASEVRYHRDNATEKRDTITAWCASTKLQARETSRYSWDYKTWTSCDDFLSSKVSTGSPAVYGSGSGAATLDDYQILSPHFAAGHADLVTFGTLQMKRHDYEASCFHGEGSVRAFCTGEYFRLTGHPQLDSHAPSEREFVITSLRLTAQNNLPKELAAQVASVFARNLWTANDALARMSDDAITQEVDSGETRFHLQFTAVRRSVDIVPRFDSRSDVPYPHLQSAIVVGPPNEQVHCDQLGRVKIRFPGMRIIDHEHAQGAGASGTVSDSAWVRVASNWAGSQASSCGAFSLPRVGTEVLVDFIGGDPDKPIIVGQLYNSPSSPPRFSDKGNVPGNRYLSGIRSREIRGGRSNQLRLDDTPGQISAQLASDHGASQLNLGWLSHPREQGIGTPRGEGAELRSDHAVSVRGAQGVLITATPDSAATGPMLGRAEVIGLVVALQGVQQLLSDLSTTHHADDTDTKELEQLLGYLKQWEAGSNTESRSTGAGGQPVVALSAPAGAAMTSQENIAIGAQTHVDMVSIGNMQLSAGKKLLARVSDSISLFAHRLGIKLIAAGGKLEIQTHGDSVEITSAKRIVLTAAEEIVLQAPKVRSIAQGAQVDLGGGAITQQSSGAHTIKSSQFAHIKPGGGAPPGVAMPATESAHDQQTVLRWTGTDEPMKNQRYRITTEDGRTFEGRTDATGLTERFKSAVPFGRYSIEALDD